MNVSAKQLVVVIKFNQYICISYQCTIQNYIRMLTLYFIRNSIESTRIFMHLPKSNVTNLGSVTSIFHNICISSSLL